MKRHNYVLILVGVCGTGKSTIGRKVADRLEVPFFDADKLLVTDGLPEDGFLQDVDLEGWLTAIKELISEQARLKGCVVSCSVLKKDQRIMLSSQVDHELDWIFMSGSYEYVAQRAEQVGGKPRPAELLKSDFESLEVPKRALTIDMTYSEQEIVDTILKYLARKYG
ncbi:shikimate kinase [Pseudozobellia thermophila]|uniref:gluconokinase n=1 Tax=Pseudozobellia thermophila TaxID=192903 RepID=A0A1M6MWF3_9FLAO|nr:shikimate kinase [Pseudozobellia thermophila]SHJ87805.1 gluconokinase [Pseudozobellia thermophila]